MPVTGVLQYQEGVLCITQTLHSLNVNLLNEELLKIIYYNKVQEVVNQFCLHCQLP